MNTCPWFYHNPDRGNVGENLWNLGRAELNASAAVT